MPKPTLKTIQADPAGYIKAQTWATQITLQQRNTLLPFVIMTEAQWQRLVIRTATIDYGYEYRHETFAAMSKGGFPDLTLWRPGSRRFPPVRSFYVELKNEIGKLSQAQVDTIDSLRSAGDIVHVWFPHDWFEVLRVLENGGDGG